MTVDRSSDATRRPIGGRFADLCAGAFAPRPEARTRAKHALGVHSALIPAAGPDLGAWLRPSRSPDEDEHDAAAGAPPLVGGTQAGDGPARKRRRRGSRGGRNRRRAGANEVPADAVAALEPHDEALDGDDEPTAAAPLSETRPSLATGGRARAYHEIDEAPELATDAPLDVPGDPSGPAKRRRRGRRGGRRRRRGGQRDDALVSGVEGEEPRDAAPEGHADDQASADERALAEGALEEAPSPRAATANVPDDGGRASKRRQRKRGSRRGRGRGARPDAPVEVEWIPGESEDDLPELERAPQAAPRRDEARDARGGEGRGRRRKGRVETEDEDDLPPQPEPVRKALILVSAADPEEKRVAVVEDGQILDFQMTVRTENSVVNDIYRGRVVNLEPAIGAAFVDFGQGRNGFLHTSDVLAAYGEDGWSLDKLLTTSIDPDEWDTNSSQPGVTAELGEEEAKEDGGRKKRSRPRDGGRRFRARPRLPITDLLKKGEMVVVQVTKDAIGDKGPTLTTYISIPGRYLVLMPSMARTGVSRKIEDEKERRRLKKILAQMEIPPGMGVIVRTAGVGRSRADLKRDLDYLKGAWEAFSRRLRAGHGPAPLYQESDIAIRTVRDLFTPGTEAVVVDDSQVHQQIVEFTQQLMPEAVDRVKLYTGAKPLFHSYGVEADFEKIFSRRIELPSGGSIVFDQAEALVAIDVNSGRTRTDSFDFEQIALKTNLEAVPEIARQIRLRDLGGIIVVDFIDMMRMANIRSVEREFKAALDSDRARSKIGRISQFGLLELTRQRLGPGMNKKVFTPCGRCRGTGRVRTVESRAAAILRRLGSAMTLKGFSTVEVRAHPEVVRYLREQCDEYLRALEYRFEREIHLTDVADQAEDSVLRYLRTDGREVRPGGRRKR